VEEYPFLFLEEVDVDVRPPLIVHEGGELH
jgi:hypothetical protein